MMSQTTYALLREQYGAAQPYVNICTLLLVCVLRVFGRVFGCASLYVCVCVCINVCVYVCMPVMLWKLDRMKHAEVQQSKVHVNTERDKWRVWGLITRRMKPPLLSSLPGVRVSALHGPLFLFGLFCCHTASTPIISRTVTGGVQ